MHRKPLENKVAKKAIEQIDPVSFLPKATNIVAFDIKAFLFKDIILKEKEFRQALKEFDFSIFENKHVYTFCSSNAIIPMWAYMLVVSYVKPICHSIVFAESISEAEELFLIEQIKNIDLDFYKNKRVVIKGCGNKKFSANVYTTLVSILLQDVKSIAFGEACSMVPISKNKK